MPILLEIIGIFAIVIFVELLVTVWALLFRDLSDDSPCWNCPHLYDYNPRPAHCAQCPLIHSNRNKKSNNTQHD